MNGLMWEGTCSDPDFSATIELLLHEGTRPFYWTIRTREGGLGMLHSSTQPTGFAKTLNAAKSMCAREIRWNRSGAKLQWKQT